MNWRFRPAERIFRLLGAAARLHYRGGSPRQFQAVRTASLMCLPSAALAADCRRTPACLHAAGRSPDVPGMLQELRCPAPGPVLLNQSLILAGAASSPLSPNRVLEVAAQGHACRGRRGHVGLRPNGPRPAMMPRAAALDRQPGIWSSPPSWAPISVPAGERAVAQQVGVLR